MRGSHIFGGSPGSIATCGRGLSALFVGSAVPVRDGVPFMSVFVVEIVARCRVMLDWEGGKRVGI